LAFAAPPEAEFACLHRQCAANRLKSQSSSAGRPPGIAAPCFTTGFDGSAARPFSNHLQTICNFEHERENFGMSMADRDGQIWYDGKLVPWRDANTHVLTHSLHYGLAVFEGVRAYKTDIGTAIFRLKDHTDRLFNSAHIYMMKIPYTRDQLMAAQKEVVRVNQLESCYIRPIAFYGSEKMGVSPKGATVHVAIAAWPWGAYLGPEALEKGIRVKTSSFARHHVNVSMCRAKYSGTYANSILANLEATEHGYDEGLLLDVDGFVAEGSGENLFMVKNGKLYEPELTSALIGITRDSIITLAQEMGYEVVAKRITRDDLYIADEAFFTGTAAEVTPIREVDGRIIGSGKRGPVTAQLQKKFFDCVNAKTAEHRDWLSPVAA
jgi:branched-chain amino acid aminotransferase